MPAIALHYYFGQDILPLLNEEISAIIEQHKEAFETGLQGPDIFYYYRPLLTRKIRNYGNALHKQNAESFFTHALACLNESYNQEALAYCLGCICHYILDSQYHPYIRGVTRRGLDHMALEVTLDWHTISSRQTNPKTFKRFQLIHKDVSISDTLIDIHQGIKEDKILKSIKAMRRFNKLQYYIKAMLKSVSSRTSSISKKLFHFSSFGIQSKLNERYDYHISVLDKLYSSSCTRGKESIELFYRAILLHQCQSDMFDLSLA